MTDIQKKLWGAMDTAVWCFPFLSAVLLIISVPPVGIWQLSFVGYVPLFLYYYKVQHHGLRALGTFMFVVLHAGFLTYLTLSGFRWIDQAEFFELVVRVSGSVAAVLVAMFSALCIYVASRCVRMGSCTVFHAAACLLMVHVLLEFLYSEVYMGFNYGALFFGAQESALLRALIELGDPIYISGAAMVINVTVAASVLFVLRRESLKVLWAALAGLVVVLLLAMFLMDTVPASGRTVSVAVIQDAHRREGAFGEVHNGVFSFPLLENHLAEAQTQDVEIIVYPFAPWSGVMSDSMDNTRFDRDVIGMSDQIFATWLSKHLKPEVVFVMWYTTYRNGEYFNEIGYFKNGEQIAVYQKEKLFPFFDYVPQWALEQGIVSLPFDGTAGTDNVPYVFKGVAVGSLVCSEIGDAAATANSAQSADILFSLGSETMFNHRIPAEYNALRAQLSAELHNIPVLRANKFGPSVAYDANGNEIGRVGFDQTAIMYVSIPLPE